MKYQFMKDNSIMFPVKKMATVFKISRSCYYAWLKREPSSHELRDKELITEITRIFDKKRKLYGSPRIYREIHGTKYTCSRSRIARLMRENGIVARQKKRYKVTTDSSHDYPVSPNLLDRNFSVNFMNQCWVSDITYSVPGVQVEHGSSKQEPRAYLEYINITKGDDKSMAIPGYAGI